MTVAPADVESTVRTVLLPLGVHVSTRVPNDPTQWPDTGRPDEFVRLTRVGGSRANLVQERPAIAVECWSTDSVAAFSLASRAWDLLEREYGPDCDLSSPVNFPDTESAQARYQFTARPYVAMKETT